MRRTAWSESCPMFSAEFEKLVHRRFSVLPVDILLTAWRDRERLARLTGVDVPLTRFESMNGDFYFPVAYLQTVEARYHASSPTVLQAFVDQGVLQGEQLRTFARTLMLPDDRSALIKLFWSAVEELQDLMVFLLPTHPFAEMVRHRVSEMVARHGISSAVIDTIVMSLSTPSRPDGLSLERRALMRLRQQVPNLSKEELDRALEKHQTAFGYLGYREPFAAGYSVEFFRERLHRSEPLRDTKPEPTLKFSAEEQVEIHLLREFVFFRTYRTERMYEALFFIEPLWRALARSFALADETDLGWYRLEEVRTLFKSAAPVDERQLDERRRGFGLSLANSRIELLTGGPLAARHRELEPEVLGAMTVWGTSASPGVVRGRARIVLTAANQAAVRHGDVLVASMTTPNFLPAMERATAFVTDEGGITCHAAIVAREMRKPCVIGTKIATKVFKDGDWIEVNADEGTVRKLDRRPKQPAPATVSAVAGARQRRRKPVGRSGDAMNGTARKISVDDRSS